MHKKQLFESYSQATALQKQLPPLSRFRFIRQCRRAKFAPEGRKSRPFQREVRVEPKDELTEDELLTEAYLQELGEDEWADDPPGHKSGYVAIVGRPNAGKSTLVNALVGRKLSIVTAKAQTTRHRILSLLNEADFQMVLLDTPGILETQRNKLDSKMMRSVWKAARDADAILAIVDSSAKPKEALESLNQILFEAKESRKLPIALIVNKVDTMTEGEAKALEEWFLANSRADAVLLTSALRGTGVDEVKRWAAEQLSQGPSLYPKNVVSEEPERFFIAEIVREQIFLQYREEVPYSSTAEVTDYVERAEGKDLVRVAVTVESDSQRGIVIGKGGSALKQLSTAARLGIEEFLGKPVFLDVSVKVKKGWRADEASVSKFGY